MLLLQKRLLSGNCFITQAVFFRVVSHHGCMPLLQRRVEVFRCDVIFVEPPSLCFVPDLSNWNILISVN